MDMLTLLAKAHVIVAFLSLAIFLVRGVWMLAGNPAVSGIPALASASLSILLLLVSGLVLLFMRDLPLDGWVVTKTAGLAAYVLLGVISLKPGLGKIAALGLWLAGLAAFGYTYLVASHWLPALY